jgi:AraC-like DNA-binding protein
MSLIYEERSSDSPYIDTIMRGQTTGSGATIRPAASSWHMVFVRHTSGALPLIVGPWTSAGIASWEAGAEILWVRFKLGVFMPHQSPRDFLNQEVRLPNVSSKSFWLKDSAWQYPDYENAETFISRLVREELLAYDPVVCAALQGQEPDMSSRTVRHRFLRATGLTRSHIRQVERAQQAAGLLQQGVSIPDTVYELGYFDQPHLTRALKQFVGQTPKQWVERPPTETIQLGVPQ